MRVRARDRSGGHASDSGSRRQVRSASRAHKNAQSKTTGRSRTPGDRSGSHQRGKSPSSNSSSKKDKKRGHKSRRPPLLKTEMVVKKTGGTMLTINGAKVDFAKNAFGGKKDKFVFAPVPSPVRGYSSPWLGPNLRLASEIQMIWAPSKLKTPCSVFLPFTFASALELTTEEATERAKTLIAAAAAAAAAAAKAAKEAAAAAAEAGAEAAEKPKQKKSVKHEKNKADYTALDVPILDTRTVFVLQAKIGDEFWTLKQNVVFVQPLIHYLEWPPQVLKEARMAGRYSEYKEPRKPEAPLPTEAANSPANKAAGGKSRKSAAKAPAEPAPEILPAVEVARRTEMLAGGICFEADEFNDFFAIVIATPSEAVEFDREGGLLRSPLLHPLLSVRIPKLSTTETRSSTFKVIDVRPDMMPSIHNFDPQLTDINECSPIYEMDLGLKPFERPVYLQLPLPTWYMNLIDKMLNPPESESHSSPEETATHRDGAALPTAMEDGEKAEQQLRDENANNVIPLEKRPKNLLLLYQAPGTKRQIVWRVADGDPNSDTEKVRRKAQKTGPYRDAHQSSTMRAENLRVKSGWLNLMLGVKGGSWKPIPITGPFTPRTLNITTYQLGRFVFLYNNDPFRTPASKLAHLMGRLEALCVAPPGVLLICLQVTPLKWNLWISVVPSSKLIDALEERLKEGYVPLVQHNASLMRKAYAVANCAVQSMPALVPPPAEDEDPITIPVFGNTKYRLTGYDLLHVLLYNGLCVKVRILGRTQFKVAGTFDVFSNVLESRRRETKMSYSDRSLSATVSDVDPADFDLSVGTAKKQPKEPVYVPPPIAKPEAYITRLETRLFYNELLSESGTIIELEPAKDWTSESHRTQMTRDKLVRLLMDRRLEQLDKEPPPEDTAPAANQTTANNDVMMHNNVPTDESMELRDLLKTETLKDNLSERDDNGILFSELMRRGNNVSPAVSLMDTDNEEDALGVESKWQQVNRSNVSVRNSERTSEMTEPTSSLTVELFPGYDGDDGVTRQHFTDLKEAFSAKNSPTLSFEIVKDMARRFCNICDKGKTESASEFVKSMFEICNVGRIELYLIQPQELAQVRERQKEEVNINDILGSNVNAEVITNGEEPDDQGFVEGHNTMKWKNTKPEADEDDEDKPKPLAAFDILIDPAIFAMNVKSKSKKGKN